MILATVLISSMPQLAPTDHAGSYSTLSILRPLYAPEVISTSFLHATGQAWQVGSCVRMCSLTYSPLMRSPLAPKDVSWLFFVGKPPIVLVMFINTLVPYTDSPPFFGEVTLAVSMIIFSACRRAVSNAGLSVGWG